MSAQLLKEIPSNLWVVLLGSISFQEISYAGKPQVEYRYIYTFKSMTTDNCVAIVA
jgi:hypothetical protein